MKHLSNQNTIINPRTYHFVGIGGIGMSAIAQILKEQGHNVSGSDRSYDKQIAPQIFSKLSSIGITLTPQDGSGINEATDFVIVSSAIEEQNPDIMKARSLSKTITKRASLLANMFNDKFGIAIGGTNGKTTVSSMVGYVLDHAGMSPTIIVGGCIKNYLSSHYLGNAKVGTSDIITIEADESDGSIVYYTPKISIITNMSKDHKPLENISKMFETFSLNTQDVFIINADCPELKKIQFRHNNIITYGFSKSADVYASNIVNKPYLSTFDVDGQSFELKIPGMHNVSNALAAISVARCMNIKDNKIAAGLYEYKGVQRRIDIIGEYNGIKVIDDFAHNPEKIAAAIKTIKLGCNRVIAIFQPHGYFPTHFMKEELINAFKHSLSPNDLLFMPEIYYAGGSASREISSANLIHKISKSGRNAFFIEKREDIIPEIVKTIKQGDCILVMGARDNTLTDFCYEILHTLQKSK
ncbi:MAG: UDP-N-acetylmuramate--L-alanine ligase [Candidatus Kuenenia sp.]|nr:UDP-N-acetylmuramate--L-alanine ligase [Candidatus Kuenenia hertensis]